MPCRFAENPLVLNEPFIRFYAGAPLITSTGHRLGSLCIIDRKPRELEAESCNVLINFAEVVMRELEKEKMRVRGPQTLVSCAPLSRAAASNLAGMCASEICDSKASGLKQWHGSSMRKRCGKPVHQLAYLEKDVVPQLPHRPLFLLLRSSGSDPVRMLPFARWTVG